MEKEPFLHNEKFIKNFYGQIDEPNEFDAIIQQHDQRESDFSFNSMKK